MGVLCDPICQANRPSGPTSRATTNKSGGSPMWSRRSFLRQCVASSAGLAWAVHVRAEEKLDPLLTEAAQKAVKSGQAYLKAHQHKDGSVGTNTHDGSRGIPRL